MGVMAGKDIHRPVAAHLAAPNEEAQHAANDEKSMGLIQALKLYPKAVGWSVVLSSALIMEGYDLALLGSLYGSPMFNRKYGVLNEKTRKWAVQPSWQSAL
jgi:SP family general alpha glucoside:H+ symporter-like MFS transporter